MKRIIVLILALFSHSSTTFSQDTEYSKTNFNYWQGNFCISSNSLFEMGFPINDSSLVRTSVSYGLAPSLEYAVATNFFFGLGFSYKRQSYFSIPKQDNNEFVDFTLNTKYYFRTSKKTPHFLELMYLGGERAYYKQNMAFLGSKMPYTSKIRFIYGFDLQTKKIENLSFTVKVHYTTMINRKSHHTDDTNFNVALNYYFSKLNSVNVHVANEPKTKSAFNKGNFCLSNNLLLNGLFTSGDTVNQQIVAFGLAHTFEYAFAKKLVYRHWVFVPEKVF